MKASKKIIEAAKSIGRITALIAIFGIDFIGLMAEPYEDSNWWFEQFFVSKAIAAAGFFAFWKLYQRWSKSDRWLKAYNECCDKALEAPNPLYIGEEDDK